MKLCFKYKKKLLNDKKLNLIKKFCDLLQKKLPLQKDLTIVFLDKKQDDMTTGSYNKEKSRIRVLFGGRMMSDILRTLSHEWSHAYDSEKLKIKDRRDVGGESEDYANSKSGEYTKMFIKKNKKIENEIFN